MSLANMLIVNRIHHPPNPFLYANSHEKESAKGFFEFLPLTVVQESPGSPPPPAVVVGVCVRKDQYSWDARSACWFSGAGRWSMPRKTVRLLGTARFIHYLTIKPWGHCRGRRLKQLRVDIILHQHAWAGALYLFTSSVSLISTLCNRPLCCDGRSLSSRSTNFVWLLSFAPFLSLCLISLWPFTSSSFFLSFESLMSSVWKKKNGCMWGWINNSIAKNRYLLFFHFKPIRPSLCLFKKTLSLQLVFIYFIHWIYFFTVWMTFRHFVKCINLRKQRQCIFF